MSGQTGGLEGALKELEKAIDERKHADEEQALLLAREQAARAAAEAASARFRGLLEAAPDGIVIVDKDAHIALVNAQTEKLFGYTRDELIGLPIETLVPERYRDAHVGHRTGYIGHPRTRPMGVGLDLYARRKDGSEFPVEISLSPLEVPDGVLITAIVRDITRRKRIEEEIRLLNEDLKRRAAELENSNQELEAFSYSVSHDLRAPLRSIDGFSQALLEDYSSQLDEAGQDYLNRVRAASQRMGQLIDDILKLSRVIRAEMRREMVDLSALARSVAEQLQQTQPDRQVEWEIADGLVAEGDPHLLGLALQNLIGNAWKFTGKQAHARIEFGSLTKDGQLAYFVGDNGAGFDMAYVDKLFRAFQRLHAANEFEGTGIGLATVQRIVRRHGGRVWAESAIGQGATFYFTLGG